jgi:hypothetical protein
MVRIAKRGYVEVPSRVVESCRGSEPGIAGLSHHRWLIDIGAASIRFLMKFHSIHSWKYSLPASYLCGLSEQEKVQWLFWEGYFEFSATTINGLDNQLEELERFGQLIRPYSMLALAAESGHRNDQLLR